MKKIILLLCVFILTQFLNAQQNVSAKRIEISSPSYAQLTAIKEAGFDLACDAIFKDGNLILELGQQQIEDLESINMSFNVLEEDLYGYYQRKNSTELPAARARLEQMKFQGASNRQSASTSSVSIDNLIQFEGCSEIDWAVPTNFNLGSMGGCLTYSEVLVELDQMRALYPNLISVKTDASPTNQVTHGNSFTNGGQYNTWPGQTIYYVKISDNPDTDEVNEPESLYSGMTHSREVSSMMNLIYYMWYILENYDTDAGIKNLVDNHEMYFMPVANPDGLLWNEQIAPSGGGLQRKNLGPYNTGDNNLRGVDLNRNYDYFWGPSGLYGGSSGSSSSNTFRGPTAFSEPETQIVRDFSATRQFKTAMNHHATSNLIPHAYNGYPAAPASGREAEFAKFCHDMTRYNRYIYGEAPDILTIANGDMSDWMLGGVSDVNGSTGSGQGILALAPENGAWDGSEGSFWPNAADIVNIAKRAVRMNFVNAYHSGKFARFHDLNTTDITTTTGNLEFGLEYLGQTLGGMTLNVTPVSSNITSITPPATQTGWSKLEQRTVTAAYSLNAGIQPNDIIEFEVTLSNDDGYVMYQANITKVYNPSLIFFDNPDINGTTNWTTSGGAWGITSDAYSGASAITDSPSGSYGNNSNKSIALTNFVNLSGANSGVVVQFYAKWDLERNFDYVQIQGSTNGTNWVNLCGKYTKPGSDFLTNRYNSSNSSNTSDPNRTSTTNQPSGQLLYDGDTMDKWVMEEIFIDGSNNTSLFGQSNVKFRFVLDSDNTNRADGYPTTFDGFTFDDFKIISLQLPCVESVPTNLSVSAITSSGATINWDNIISATYDLRYREVGASEWNDVLDLTPNSYDINSLIAATDYEVQVRSKCGTASSAYSPSLSFTTATINYCSSASTNVNDEFISRVQINTIDNASGAQFYSDFTTLSTTLTKETQYTITITPTWTGTVYNEAYSVWIDYNGDGDFLDAEEQVWTQSPTQATTVTGNFMIPASANETTTRMRVSMKYNDIPTSCETFTYGEVEDYTVIIEAFGPDTMPPVIILNGASTIDLDLSDAYNEQGATANDNIDGDITSNIVIGGDIVDTNTAETYLVTYNVSDASGNAATEVVRTVNVVPDTTPPVIILNGSSAIDLDIGDTYNEQGATATDNIDGDITANIVIGGDMVDTSTVGTYVITYNVSDNAGNAATEVTRTVNVNPDSTPPVITLNGSSIIDLNVGDIYTEEGATATDNIDGDITANIVIGGDVVDANTAGIYLVTYNIIDAAGNAATEVARTVNVIADTTPPVITLIGTSVINLDVGDTYNEQGATAIDNIDGDITANIVIGGDTVDTNTADNYVVTYDIFDAAGNAALQVIRTVIVVEPTNGCSGGISSFPYNEGFENTLGAWTQATNDDLNWTIDANGTPSSGTGPSSAIQGTSYIYVEASGNNVGYPNKRAIINSPCFDLSGLTEATFSFNYHQFGSSNMGTLDLEASNDNGITWVSIWTSSGNLGNSWQSASVDISSYVGGGLQLRFNRLTGGTWQADIAIDNVSLSEGGGTVGNGCTGGISTFPYNEGFENTLGAWTQATNDDLNWTIDANGTPSSGTGPSSAIQGTSYIYVEASGNNVGYPNKRAIINSPCFDLSGLTEATFSFNYHQFGSSNMGTLDLEASNDNGITWVSIWTSSGNLGNSWQSASVDISSYVGGGLQLRFNRLTGGTWQADIAIDNIGLTTVGSFRNLKTDISNKSNVYELKLYPIPVKSVLNIALIGFEAKTFEIKNMIGQLILKGGYTNTVNVAELEAGVYILQLNNGKKMKVKRFIKE